MHVNYPLARAPWRLRGAAVLALSVALLAPARAQRGPATVRLLPEDALRGLYGPQHNFDFQAPGAGDNDYQTAGFFGQNLRPFLASSPEALGFLNNYRRQKTLFLVDRVVAIGAFGLYGQQIFFGDEPRYFNSIQQVAIGAFAASVLATAFINRNTNTHLLRAVKAYNAGVAQNRAWPRLRPATVGLSLAPTGQPMLALRWALR